jgi:hypothetical protein
MEKLPQPSPTDWNKPLLHLTARHEIVLELLYKVVECFKEDMDEPK